MNRGAGCRRGGARGRVKLSGSGSGRDLVGSGQDSSCEGAGPGEGAGLSTIQAGSELGWFRMKPQL